jgi:hypothetical protein
MKNNVVYLHRKLTDNSVFYIGIGSSDRPYVFRGRNNLWNKIYNKYGCFVDVVKTNLTREEAIELEILLISHFGKIKDNSGILCNMTDGGDGIRKGYKHTNSFRNKRRKIMLGNTLTKGAKLSKEHRKKISIGQKGRKAWNKGIKYTEERKEKLKKTALSGIDNPNSCRVFVDGIWFDTMNEAGKFISNRTTVLNRCKSRKWNYYREGYNDPIPNK